MEEARHWAYWVLKNLPGYLGVVARNALLPYRRGRNVRIWDAVHIDYPSRLTIGSDVSINRGSILNCGGNISIGDRVLIGPRVIIYSQNHVFGPGVDITTSGYSYHAVRIGSGVWIGAGAMILPGVEIGDNAVVGAASVVTKSVPPGALVVGNPARVVRRA